MSSMPNPKEFREHVERVAYRLENGMYTGTYNHADSCKCVVGLALEDYFGETLDLTRVVEFTIGHPEESFRKLYGTWDMNDTSDPHEGAEKARVYLRETADLETV